MKLHKKDIEGKDGSGYVKVTPEHPEDMWHLYNIISRGDSVRASTVRKIQRQTSSTVTSSKKRLMLTLAVKEVSYDPSAESIRIKGKNTVENPYVKLGQYHTVELELNHAIVIIKSTWDAIHLDRLSEACDVTRTADVAAVVCQADGTASICLVTSHMTVVRQQIKINIPSKRTGSSRHERAVERFHRAIYEGILRHINFDIVKAVIIASPGFVKDQVWKFLQTEAARRDDKVIMSNKPKFLLVRSTSGYKHALKEVLDDPKVAQRLSDTKATGEVQALNRFYKMLTEDEDRAVYGVRHVEHAAHHGAVEQLLITDGMFRTHKVSERRRYVNLCDEVKAAGGEVLIFSTMHVSGEQLAGLTGVAAILRFPLQLEDEDEDDEEEEEESDENEDEESTSSEEESAEINGLGPAIIDVSSGDNDSSDDDDDDYNDAVIYGK